VIMLLLALACTLSPAPLLAADGEEISYNGAYSSDAPNYAKGKPVSIVHGGGNISIRCMDVDGISARISYNIYGTDQGIMQRFGDGILMAVSGDANGGSVKTKIPSKPAGVNSSEIALTINIPKGPGGVSVTQTGSGWVEIMNCAGTLKVTSGSGGMYASGNYTSLNVTAPGKDIKIEQDPSGLLTGTSLLSAPQGSIALTLPNTQGGTMNAKANEVSVAHLVMGTNMPSVVQGAMGTKGPTLTLTAKERVEVKFP